MNNSLDFTQSLKLKNKNVMNLMNLREIILEILKFFKIKLIDLKAR
jgi:hypothetical protein